MKETSTADISAQTSPDNVTRDTWGFPSHFVDPATKKEKDWCLAYAKAFHNEAKGQPTEAGLFRNNTNYSRYRKYARGEQSEEQYKELLGLKKNQGSANTSFRNLDFSIFKIGSKMRNVLSGQVLNQKYKINAKVIDPTALNERRLERNKILEAVINQEAIERWQRLSKMGLESPFQPGVSPPQNMQEIDPYMDMHPKDMMAMEVKDYLTMNLAYNDWPQLEKEVVIDLIEVGVAAIRPWIDSNGVIKLRRGIPERIVTNKCLMSDFRDLIRVGEYHEMTIADLKQRTRGSLGEDVYKAIANTVAGSPGSAGGSGQYSGTTDKYWSDNTYSYAYDREKITIFDACWYSVDKEVYKDQTNGRGNGRFEKEKFNYVPFKGDANVNGGQGMSDDEYAKQTGKKLYRKDIKNVYQCQWVVGTNVAFDYGLMTNMVRAASSYCDAKLPWIIRTTDFISSIGNIESPLDQFQLNWLQFQSHVAASKPDGIAIEKRSLAKLSSTGQAGLKWDPKEALRMYAEIGSFVFDGYDQHGEPLPWLPIKELKNGLSESAFKHLQIMIQMVDLMRQILGINPLVEGAAPPERLANGVAQMSMGATSNALSYLTDAYKALFESTCKMVVDLIPNALEYSETAGTDTISEALGTESFRFFNLNKDLGLREMGIILEEGPDDVVRQRISDACKIAVDKLEMDPEDAIMIELEENPYRAILMIRKKRRENQQRKQGEAMQLQQQNIQGQQQLEKQKADQKQADDQAETQKTLALETMKQQWSEQDEQKKWIRAMMLEKMKHGFALSEMEQKVIDNVIEIHAQGKIDKEVAVIQADASAKKAASSTAK